MVRFGRGGWVVEGQSTPGQQINANTASAPKGQPQAPSFEGDFITNPDGSVWSFKKGQWIADTPITDPASLFMLSQYGRLF